MRIKLNSEYLGFPAGTIVETSSLGNRIDFPNDCTYLSLNDTPPVTVPYLVNKVASANVRNSFDASAVSTSDVYEKIKTITLTDGLLGGQRFLFDLGTNDVDVTAYGKIYRNGVAIGTEQTSTSGIGSITLFTATPVAAGTGYLPDEVLTVAGGTGGTVTVATIAGTGGLSTVTLANGGTGYVEGAGNILTVVQGGGASGTISCTANSGGVIVSIDSVTVKGTGYAVANTLATTGGSANTDATVNITVINGAVASFTTTPTHDGHGYTTGTKATAGSASGVGATVAIATVSTYTTESEDIVQAWLPQDTCELWVHSDGAATAGVRNFRIAYDDAPLVAVTSTNS